MIFLRANSDLCRLMNFFMLDVNPPKRIGLPKMITSYDAIDATSATRMLSMVSFFRNSSRIISPISSVEPETVS
jgi:hypothetical protein